MALMRSKEATLVLVDFQERLMPAIDNGAGVAENARRLGEAARMLAIPAVQTLQYPKGLGQTVPTLAAFGTPVEKTSFGCCASPAFMSAVAKPDVIVAGCETHVCVMQTVLGLLEAGKTVFVVADACGSRTAENKQLGLARMRHAGAEIVSTEMVVFEWLGDSTHPAFRDVSRLIR